MAGKVEASTPGLGNSLGKGLAVRVRGLGVMSQVHELSKFTRPLGGQASTGTLSPMEWSSLMSHGSRAPRNHIQEVLKAPESVDSCKPSIQGWVLPQLAVQLGGGEEEVWAEG